MGPPRAASWWLAGLVAAAWCGGASAWGHRGHHRILQVASTLLKEKHRLAVEHMMGGHLLDFSKWEETMLSSHPETAYLHWHHQSPEWNCSSAMDTKTHLKCDRQGSGGSLFCALAYFFQQCAHHTLLEHYPKPKVPINTPDELGVLNTVRATFEIKPAHNVRWLVALLADLHQPLHMLPAHDFGRKITVKYKGKEQSLLSFFEDTLLLSMPALPTESVLQAHFKTEMRHWHSTPRKRPVELFRHWGKDVARIACKEILSAMDPIDEKIPFEVDEAMFSRWVNVTHELTVRAGERVAFSLLDVLEHKKHKEAHKEGRGAYHPAHLKRPDAFYNALIAFVVVPSLLFFFRWHEGGARNAFGRVHAKV